MTPANLARFHLEKILKLQVFGHAKGLAGFNLETALVQFGEWVEGGLLDLKELFEVTPVKANRWRLVHQHNEFETLALPSSLKLFYQMELAKLDPELSLRLIQNRTAVRWLPPKDPLVSKLQNGQVQAIIDWYPPVLGSTESTLLAKKVGSAYQLTGRKNRLVGALEGIELVYLVFALSPTEEGDKIALFRVGGRGVQMCGTTWSIQADFDQAPAELLAWAPGADAQADLWRGARLELLALQTALVNEAARLAGEASQEQEIPDLDDPEKTCPLFFNPRAAEELVGLKALSAGLLGASLKAGFYQDCLTFAEQGLGGGFAELLDLYLAIFLPFVHQALWEAQSGARRLGGDRAPELTEQARLAFDLAGLTGSDLDQELRLQQLVTEEEGRIFLALFEEFGQLEAQAAKTDSIKESVMQFKDYAGGLFLLVADLRESTDPKAMMVSAGKISRLFAEVILAFGLITQAKEAERALEKAEVNFYNLGQQVLSLPELWPWYNLLVVTEQWSVQRLSGQDAAIRLVQKGPKIALDALLAKAPEV